MRCKEHRHRACQGGGARRGGHPAAPAGRRPRTECVGFARRIPRHRDCRWPEAEDGPGEPRRDSRRRALPVGRNFWNPVLGGWCFSPKNGESESKSSMIPRVVFRKNEKSTSLLGGWCFSPKNGEGESKSSMIPRVVFRKNEKSTSLLGGWCFSPKNGEGESKSSMIPRVVFRKNEKSTSLLVRRSRSSSPDRREGSLKAAFRDGTGVCSPAPGGGYRLRASPPATCSLRGPDPAPLASPP